MTKDKAVRFCDIVVEWCFYSLIFFVTFSNSLVEVAATAMIVFWAAGLVLRKDAGRLRSLPAALLAAYFVWVVLSCFNTAYPSESFRGVFTKALQYSLIFMVMATQTWSKLKLKRFLLFSAAAVLMAGSNGIFQYFTGTGIIRGRELIADDHLRRISSSFVHPNDFGAYLMVMATLFISVVISFKGGLKRNIFLSAALALALVCLFLTVSRGAWLSFAAALVALGVLKAKKVAAGFVAVLIAVLFFMPSEHRQRIYELPDLESGTTWERIMIWRGTFDMIKEHPVLGFGVNTFSRHFPDYKPEEYPDDRYAHNCYLQMAAEIGIVGALLFLAFILTTLFYSIRKSLAIPLGDRKDIVTGLSAGCIGFVLNSAVDTHLFSLTLAVFFHLLLGACFSMSVSFGEEP